MRDPNTKWYLSKKEYKFDSFPIWFQGLAYMLSPPLAKEIYKLSFTTPYLFTGIAIISPYSNYSLY